MYLVDIPEKESEAIKRLLKLLPITTSGLFESFGLNPLFSWYLVEVRTDLHLGLPPTDIDILAGHFNCRDPKAFQSVLAEEVKSNPNTHPSQHRYIAYLKLAESGGINWPPLTNYSIGIEAKCAYFDTELDNIKSKKSSREKVYKIREQVEKLLLFGFDKVALLDMIANPPASGINGWAWVEAANTANVSKEVSFDVEIKSKTIYYAVDKKKTNNKSEDKLWK